MKIRMTRARPEQASRLSELAHESKRHWGYPEHYIDQWKSELTVSEEFLRLHTVFVALLEDRAVGFYALIDNGERMELEHFWVAPAEMSMGVGRLMLRHAVEYATLAGAEAIDISSDPNAERFYIKMGARRVGRIPAPVEGRERYLPRLTLELSPAGAPSA